MKKAKYILYTIILSINVIELKSQTYRELYDKIDQNDPNGDSFKSNLDKNLQYEGYEFMQSYINMYYATKDLKYLHKLVIHIRRVMDSRDYCIHNASPTRVPTTFGSTSIYSTDLSGVYVPGIGFTFPTGMYCWSRVNDNGALRPHHMDTGQITFPMAEFVLLIMENPSLQSIPLPTEAIASPGLVNFGDFTNWLKPNIYAALDFHVSNDWDPTVGRFVNPIVADYSPNENCTIGRTFILMAYIANLDGDSHYGTYQNIVEELAYFLKLQLTSQNPTTPPTVGGANNIPWYTLCHEENCSSGEWEDVSHAWIEDEFVYYYYQYFNMHLNFGRFDNTDLEKFANGFAYRVLTPPLQLRMNIYGTDGTVQNPNCYLCTGYARPDNYYRSAPYCFLSPYNPQIYQEISDMYAPDGINYNVTQGSNFAFIAYSQLALYEKLFNPITTKRNTGAHNYSGAAKGDFEGTGQIEFASLNNNNGTSSFTSYSINPNDNSFITTSNSSFANNFKYLAAGDIDPNNPGDELMTIDVQNNKLVLLKKQGNQFSIISQTSLTIFGGGTGSYFGIATGEFNLNYGEKEVLINTSQGLFLFGYDSNGSVPAFVQIPLMVSIQGGCSSFAIGDYNGDGFDDVAIADLIDNKIGIYSIIHAINSTNPQYYFNLLASGDLNTNPSYYYTSIDGTLLSGDFDGDGIDEIILYRNIDGYNSTFQVYRQNNTDVVFKNEEYFPANQENGIMCSMRLPNYPQSDALITFRNYDGQISVFNMDGLCPGLNLNNQTIDGSTSTGNSNYPIDYHVNNKITVGNGYSIDAPSIVEMSSGKEIDYKPGATVLAGSDLHAYIDPALTCNPATFRRPNATPAKTTPSYSYNEERQKPVVNNAIKISPNPNSGSFQVTVTRNEKPTGVKEVRVFDIMGKEVWRTGPSSNNVFNIDITAYSQGIYYVRSINGQGELEIKKLIKE